MSNKTCNILHINQNCLNTKRPYARLCRICIDGCPNNAISESKSIDLNLCTECGLCTAVCPSDGFVSPIYDELFEYMLTSEAISLYCVQGKKQDFEIPCLAMFNKDSWGSMLTIAKEKITEINIGVCTDCPNSSAYKTSEYTLNKFYSQKLIQSLISIKVVPNSVAKEKEELNDKLNSSTISRREAFGFLRKFAKDKVKAYASLSTPKIEGYEIPKSRQWVIKLLKDRPETVLPYLGLEVLSECTSCGVCIAICPQRALTKYEMGDKFKIILEPSKCVNCNRCIEICRNKALKSERKKLTHRFLVGKVLLHEGSQLRCERCGRQMFERKNPMLCVACDFNNSFIVNFNNSM